MSRPYIFTEILPKSEPVLELKRYRICFTLIFFNRWETIEAMQQNLRDQKGDLQVLTSHRDVIPTALDDNSDEERMQLETLSWSKLAKRFSSELAFHYGLLKDVTFNFEFAKPVFQPVHGGNTLVSVSWDSATSQLHQLPYETFHCQYAGKTRAVLFDPLQTRYLYPRAQKPIFNTNRAVFQTSPINPFDKLESKYEDLHKDAIKFTIELKVCAFA